MVGKRKAQARCGNRIEYPRLGARKEQRQKYKSRGEAELSASSRETVRCKLVSPGKSRANQNAQLNRLTGHTLKIGGYKFRPKDERKPTKLQTVRD